jgi:hypothetical protein
MLKEEGTTASRPWSVAEILGVFIVAGVPTAFIAWTYFLSNDAPFRLAQEVEQVFQQRCAMAGEKIYEQPQNVQSIYLDHDVGAYFNDIKNGRHGGYGSGPLGGPLVYRGFLLYYETRNDRQKSDGGGARYLWHALNDRNGEPEEELTSEYGVFRKSLVTDDERKLGLSGTEVTIKNLRNDRVVASLVFFTNSRGWAICGHSGNGRFDISDFIIRSLNLTQRFPKGSS